MSFQPKILCFAGSTREDSYNKKLIRVAAGLAETMGAEVTRLDLRDFPLPLYDGDLEEKEGLPENAKTIKALMQGNHGFLISSPEYNSSISGVLKNTIDWASRDENGEGSLECFTDKFVGLLSASPGALGGLRGLVTVRSILGNIGVHVLPNQVAVGKAHEAFGPDGDLKDAKQKGAIEKLVKDLHRMLVKYYG